MASLGQLTLDLVAKIGGFTGPMDQASRQSRRTSDSISRNAKSATAALKQLAGALAIGATFKSVIAATVEQERVTAQLEQTLKSTGRYTPELSKSLQDYAGQLQGLTTYGDEAIIASQSLLLMFTQIGGEAFPRAQRAILDVATAMGTDLKSATIQVGKALNDPISGLSSLSRIGIRFSDAQKDVIKAMVETGRAAEAQSFILGELETKFGGSAEAARGTLGGSLQALKNAFGDLLEGDVSGEGIKGAAGAIEDLTVLMSSPETKAAFLEITSGVLSITKALAQGVVLFADFGKAIGEGVGRIVMPDIDTQIEQARSTLKVFLDEFNQPRFLRNNPFISTENLALKVEATRKELERLLETREMLSGKGSPVTAAAIIDPEVVAVVSDAATGTAELTKEQIKAAEAIKKQVDAIKLQADTIGMSAEAVAVYKLALEGANAAQLQQAATSLDTVAAFKAQEEAAKQAADAQKAINDQIPAIAESLMSEEEQIQSSYERRRQIILDNTLVTGEAQNALLKQLEEKRNEELLELNGGYWERYLAAAEESLSSFDELAGSVVEGFSSRFGDAFESMIFDATTLQDAVAGLAEGMARSIVNALGQMAAQWLAYQAVQLFVGKTTQASGAATLSANATATSLQAGLAAFASTAAIPIVGPIAAPGAMAAALAATGPIAASVGTIALAGMAHDGMDSVPQTGTWLLEKGERVTTAETSAKLDKTLSDLGNGGSGVTIINQTTGRIDKATEQRLPNGEKAVLIEEMLSALSNRLGDPNSNVSRSFARNTTAQRAR